MYILGISAYYHDSAACLLNDDYIVAAVQEERFSRIKNDKNFPESAIHYCLQKAEIQLADVDWVVFYEKPFLKFERLLETYFHFSPKGFLSFSKAMSLWLKEKLFLKKMILESFRVFENSKRDKLMKVLFSNHHLSHAASAFYPSPFDHAVVITADGVGEWTTTTVAIANGKEIQFIKDIKFPHSIGLLYSAFTYYLGFKVNSDEYKVMGLAPYGNPIYKNLIYANLIDVKEDGSFRLNMKYFNYCIGKTMTSTMFDILFGQKRRSISDKITEFHMDVAASIQKVTEEIMLKIACHVKKEYPLEENLCLAGGVALNCVANGKLLKHSGFKNIWIQPAAGDAGGALGAAYAVYYHYGNTMKRQVTLPDKMQNSLLGQSFTDDEIKATIVQSGLIIEKIDFESYYTIIAGYIAEGKVVGYFKGRSEYGPRALGARSIVADPRNIHMQSILNQKIKFRESFRPFAPAIMEEYVSEWFDISTDSPYMTLVANVNEKYRLQVEPEEKNIRGFKKLKSVISYIPAVTHIDYSARIQTVNKHSHSDFYQLINAFYKITGVPMILNTSFNRMNEPIVNSPSEAIECFKKTGMDILVIENYIITKSK